MPSLLGGGLLERVRSTTFALLGVTAAVGLGMVALALNQSWPVVAGSPIPGISTGEERVGAGQPVAGAAGRHSGSDAPRRGRSASSVAERPAGATPGGRGAGSPGPVPGEPSGSVHASTPLQAPAAAAPQAPARPTPVSRPVSAQPQTQATGRQPSTAPQPPATPQSPAPATPPANEAETLAATASSAPPEDRSHVPSWSQGKGHAYGRSDRD